MSSPLTRDDLAVGLAGAAAAAPCSSGPRHPLEIEGGARRSQLNVPISFAVSSPGSSLAEASAESTSVAESAAMSGGRSSMLEVQTEGAGSPGAESDGCGCWSNFTTYFSTGTRVVIKSRWLRVPELIINLSIIVGIFVYLVYYLQFMQVDFVWDDFMIGLKDPLADWDGVPGCTYFESNCRISRPTIQQRKACSKEVKEVYPQGCEFWGSEVLSPRQGDTQGLYVMVGKREYLYTCAEETDLACNRADAASIAERRVAAAAVDTFMVHIRHRFVAGHWGLAGSKAQGFLKVNGKLLRLPVRKAKWRNDLHNGYEKVFPETCGTLTGNGTDTCMDAPSGNYISIGLLLKAVGVSLQDVRPNGRSLKLRIYYTDMDRVAYWRWPWGRKPTYTIEVQNQTRVNQFADSDEYVMTTTVLDNRTRRLQVWPSLHFTVEAAGEHGRFEVFGFIVKLTVFSSAFTIGQILVNKVLIRIYSRCTNIKELQALQVLHEIAVKRKTDLTRVHDRAVLDDPNRIFVTNRKTKRRLQNLAPAPPAAA